MKTWYLLLALPLLTAACSALTDPLPKGEPPCGYPIYTPPKVIRNGNVVCPNECLHVYEGEVSFAEGWLEINCRRLPADLPNFKWTIDTTAVRDARGRPVPVIRIQSKGFAAWCRRDLIFEQPGCPLRADDALFVEYGRSDGYGDGDVTIVMDARFWACYSPSDPFFFRLTSTLPLPLDRLASAQGQKR